MPFLKLLLAGAFTVIALVAGLFTAVAVALAGTVIFIVRRLFGPAQARAIPSTPPIRPRAQRMDAGGAIDVTATELPVDSSGR